MELDAIDKLTAKAFEGYIVRKDLVRKFKGQYPVPTYVAEFLLGRYCSSTDEKEIEEGLQVVQRQLADRTVRPGEEEYFKSKARESGSIRIIDIITARLDAKNDSYIAELPSLRLRDVRITPALVQQHDRMLTGRRRSAGCSSCCIQTLRSRSPTRPWNGPCGWRWSAAAA